SPRPLPRSSPSSRSASPLQPPGLEPPAEQTRPSILFQVLEMLIYEKLDISLANTSIEQMQFEALKVFCDVARNQSFSRAADANRISQSAVSQIVNQLEKRLGVQLVDRSRRPLQLTHSGKAYYDGCKKLVEQYLEVEASIRNGNGNGSHLEVPIRVAAIYSVGLRDMS